MLLDQKPPQEAVEKKDALANPKILEVNLIKGEEEGVVFNWRKKFSILLVVVVFSFGLIAEIYFGLDWWAKNEAERRQQMTVNQPVGQNGAQLQSQANEALKYQARTVAASQLLANHIYWSKFFRWLEKNTLDTVEYSGFSGDLSGEYSLSATAKSYAEVSWQVKAFLDDPLVKNVSASAAAMSGKDDKTLANVSFPISLEINPSIFKR